MVYHLAREILFEVKGNEKHKMVSGNSWLSYIGGAAFVGGGAAVQVKTRCNSSRHGLTRAAEVAVTLFVKDKLGVNVDVVLTFTPAVPLVSDIIQGA